MEERDQEVFERLFEKVRVMILDKTCSAYSIAKKFGMTEPQIKKYRNNPETLVNMRIKTLKKFLEKGK